MQPEIQYLDDFVKDCRLRGMSHASILSYRTSLRIFIKYLESLGRSVTEVGKNELRSYIDYLKNERKISIKTIENHFAAMSSFYEYLAFEDQVEKNPVLPVRKRYLRSYKKDGNNGGQTRKLISVDEMSRLVNSIMNARDRALLTLLAKTGIRRGEIVKIDVDDVDFSKGTIKLKKTAKRTNRVVLFDDETEHVLKEWLSMRRHYTKPDVKALFVTKSGSRLNKNGVYDTVISHAKRLGFHDSNSDKLEDHFTPHCCRHWFTTHLRRAGMPREHIQELRGDVRGTAMDIYYHIDFEELRRSYLAYVPRLGIY
ncbi:MAG: tyrosine-type recombinase/integrase [Thermoplasmata archaeon]|nr:MAG: tyrosine-type recombinase/integrase [Thermoplasmata archaeon]